MDATLVIKGKANVFVFVATEFFQSVSGVKQGCSICRLSYLFFVQYWLATSVM